MSHAGAVFGPGKESIMPGGSIPDSFAHRLRDAEQRLGGLLAMTTEAIVCADDEQRIVVFNRGAEEIFGYPKEEVLGLPLESLLPGLLREAHRSQVRDYVESDEPPRRMSDRRAMVGRRKNGEQFDAEISISAVRVEGSRLVTAIVHDVSALKSAERHLRESEADLRGLIERAIFGIYRSTPDGRLLMVNQALVEMLGYDSAQQLLSIRNAAGLYQNPDQRETLRLLYAASDHFEGVEVGWKRKDGTPITARLSGKLVPGSGREANVYEVFVEDVTQRILLERQLRQSQKMESVGRLAGGIAHDFNNLLCVILGWTELATSELPDGHPVRASLGEVLGAARGAADLTRQLLAFSRRQLVEPVLFDAGALVLEMDKMFRRLINDDVAFATRTDPEVSMVEMDRGQLEQVLMNLVVNACDSMPDGGTLAIESANVALDAEYARNHEGVKPGDYVLLAVSDSGEGMSEEVQTHVFEPFFTTKEPGKGTGLGLAMCYGIVMQAGGHIAAYSELGLGTTMKVYLPRHHEGAPSAVQRRAKTPPRGVESILLVEDEPAVRRVFARGAAGDCGRT
jgi:two-component system cell cycle sensor histidine kinase/response regulator CckA